MRRDEDGAMRVRVAILTAVCAALAAAGTAAAQGSGLRGLGRSSPSQGFLSNLPSSGINRTLGYFGAYTTAESLTARREGPDRASLLAAPGIVVNLYESGWRPVTLRVRGPGPGLGPLVAYKVRSIGSLNFSKRARFQSLRETTLALAARIREAGADGLGEVSLDFRHFMFPFPVQDDPAFGTGYFSRTDLVGGGDVPRELFLGQFSHEVQQSLADERFTEATEALTLNRPLPEGAGLDQFYDTQLAALANYLFNNGFYAAAADVWKVRAERDPTSDLPHRALALCFLGAGRFKEAAAEARAALTQADGWPDALRITGSNLQDVFPSADELANVRAETEAALQRAPDDVDLNFAMAYLDLYQGNLRGAERHLAAIAATDEVAKALAGRIRVEGAVADSVRRPITSAIRRMADELTGLEEPALSAEARQRLIDVLEGEPATFEDYMRLGDFRFFMGEFNLAGEMYRKASKANPEDAFAMFARAHAAYANGEYREAVKNLVGGLALEPNWGLYEFRLQEFYGDRVEYEHHLQNLERKIELRPDAADMKFLLAYVYYFSGRYADAADLLAQVLMLEPDFERAEYFLRLARLHG